MPHGNLLTAILWSAIPAIILLAGIYYLDRYEKEPARLIAIALGAGAIVAPVADRVDPEGVRRPEQRGHVPGVRGPGVREREPGHHRGDRHRARPAGGVLHRPVRARRPARRAGVRRGRRRRVRAGGELLDRVDHAGHPRRPVDALAGLDGASRASTGSSTRASSGCSSGSPGGVRSAEGAGDGRAGHGGRHGDSPCCTTTCPCGSRRARPTSPSSGVARFLTDLPNILGLVALAVIAVWVSGREKVLVGEELQEEVASGVVTADDYHTIVEPFKRFGVLAGALGKGMGTWKLQRRLYVLEVELAFRKHHDKSDRTTPAKLLTPDEYRRADRRDPRRRWGPRPPRRRRRDGRALARRPVRRRGPEVGPMICPNCGAENAQGAPYCYNCANPLPQAGAVPPGGVPAGRGSPGERRRPGSAPGAVPARRGPPGRRAAGRRLRSARWRRVHARPADQAARATRSRPASPRSSRSSSSPRSASCCS